jgi:hypothetical protein
MQQQILGAVVAVDVLVAVAQVVMVLQADPV